MMGPDLIIDPEALRAARHRRDLTQHELARLIGVAGGERISRWELGMSAPRPAKLQRLAHVLGVSVADLLSSHSGAPDLRRLRLLAGLSVRELAESAHVSMAHLRRWEAGRFERIPPQASLRSVAAALDVRIDELERALVGSRSSTDNLVGDL